MINNIYAFSIKRTVKEKIYLYDTYDPCIRRNKEGLHGHETKFSALSSYFPSVYEPSWPSAISSPL